MSMIYSLCMEALTGSPIWILVIISSILVGSIVFRNRRFPRGPIGVPILGYLPFLDCRRLHQSLLNLGGRYGGVYSLKIGGQTIVVLNSSDVIREALVSKATSFDGRPFWMLNKVNGGRGIANEQPTREWQQHRKVWQQLSRHLLTSIDNSMETTITRDIGNIVSLLKESSGHPIDLSNIVQMALCNVICSVCFGKSFSYDDPNFRRLLKMADKFFHYLSSASAVNFFPILWYLPLKSHRAVKEGYKGIFSLVKDLVRERLRETRHTERGFVDFCIAAEITSKQLKLGEQNDRDSDSVEHNGIVASHVVKGNGRVIESTGDGSSGQGNAVENEDAICESVTYVATDLFIGGAETTHAGVMWGIVFMILYPEVQAKVQDELDAVVGEDRLPSWEDRHRLPYTQAVLQETLRLGNVIPVAIPHVTTCDVTMSDGSRLPRGTTVMANLYASHMEPRVWGDAENFRPERFLGADGHTLRRFDAFMPFSMGRRVCPGEQLARMELYLAFTHVFHSFRISLAPGGRSPSVQGRPGITHSPYPFKVSAIYRK